MLIVTMIMIESSPEINKITNNTPESTWHKLNNAQSTKYGIITGVINDDVKLNKGNISPWKVWSALQEKKALKLNDISEPSANPNLYSCGQIALHVALKIDLTLIVGTKITYQSHT